ncbi:hypothetical protein MLD38_017278 [Melastoma candidum]|uniref:Uncharacterized protein n=1 Tax=Melastoma candidum TaxID=119954 RepID=A0ACB9QQB2_9MYRT|nr:hypothetical protein MLD38_017278 [Melastoma candidum]
MARLQMEAKLASILVWDAAGELLLVKNEKISNEIHSQNGRLGKTIFTKEQRRSNSSIRSCSNSASLSLPSNFI